ncbi:hypothetical protein A3749_09415 [Oleiphilus sp. HI0078]|nr:hypothetical protein A3729_23925 [Oleiphilus sp. HI0043]KZY58619.1 hypothetical protein A3735_17395 [Oleiphilus sp. HI0061]KZY85105.1 hypothetical protein A3743_19855 [Oleiphilus sp. HI0072]KZZ11220.1 hypothetical protein A3749_09415 [Oleiphilus sp. HI0078]KZZ31861.1 hypothetical protein A3757_21345 [Oleiphilus sp. HI0117]KZZ37989.1 hypothetical protein A3756_10715 [Oleiphilus sp. HI0086]KZZ53314.1 hypothetical protein A3761_17420 [Oleiphilus sp. HI0123]KZZ64925.1 hypothetical protein A37
MVQLSINSGANYATKKALSLNQSKDFCISFAKGLYRGAIFLDQSYYSPLISAANSRTVT